MTLPGKVLGQPYSIARELEISIYTSVVRPRLCGKSLATLPHAVMPGTSIENLEIEGLIPFEPPKSLTYGWITDSPTSPRR